MTAVRYETIPILVTKWNKYYQEKVLEKKKTKNKKKYKQEKETNIARSSVSTKERREEITFRPEPPLYTHTHWDCLQIYLCFFKTNYSTIISKRGMFTPVRGNSYHTS